MHIQENEKKDFKEEEETKNDCDEEKTKNETASSNIEVDKSNELGSTSENGNINERRRICHFFKEKGYCKFGDKCHFLHIAQNEKKGICRRFRIGRECKFGELCKFRHYFTNEKKDRVCKWFLQNYQCRYKENCKYYHVNNYERNTLKGTEEEQGKDKSNIIVDEIENKMNERLHFLEERLSAAISTIQQQNLQKQMQMRIFLQKCHKYFSNQCNQK